MAIDFFRYCEKTKKSVDLYDCSRCQNIDCPKHVLDKPWRTLTPEEAKALSKAIKD